jgi:hypothetical protein
MGTLHDTSIEDNGKQNEALSLLARLLARQAARDCVAAFPLSTPIAPQRAEPDHTPTDEGGCHDG